MARTRPVPLETLKLHRAAEPHTSRPADAAARLSFADLLRSKRRPATPPPEGAALLPSSDADEEEDDTVAEAPASRRVRAHDPLAPLPEVRERSAEPPRPPLGCLAPRPEDLSAHLDEVARTRAATALASAPRAIARIAHTVTEFCSARPVAESEGWDVTLRLGRDLLPDTSLRLTLSPWWLNLRFETSDRATRDLLSSHRDALAAHLEANLDGSREIAIVVT